MGAAVSRRALLVAPVIAALAALAATLAPLDGSPRQRSPTRTFAHARALSHGGPASLSLAAQAQISGTLAAGKPAFAATRSSGGFQMANAAQGLTARFDRSGVAISGGSVSLRMSLQAIGSGGASLAAGESAPWAHANRVSYARTQLSEWYRNGPLGVEQGFTIPRALAGAGSLTLTMSLSGNAHATLARDARSIVLSHGSTSLSYGALVATDAAGRTLHSSLGLSAGKLLLRVDAAHARYPLTIDPLIQKGGKLSAGEEAGETRFGASAAVSGDGSTVLIGAPEDNGSQGAVWVFARSGSTWTQQGGKLTAPEPVEKNGEEQCIEESPEEAGECAFGSSLALSADGSTALIGEPSATSTPGAAWVFTREGSTWTPQASLTGPANASGEGRFGKSVALSADGDTALIGVPSGTGARGGAWLFTRSGAAWTRQLALLDSEASQFAHFGRSVALSADAGTALIGGPGDASFHGAAWTFTRVGATWVQDSNKLTGGASEVGDGRFGKSVALSADGNTALVGAQNDSEGRGAVWPYTRSGSAFTQGEKLTLAWEPDEGRFGATLALSGDGNTALIGAPHAETGLGSVAVLTRSGSTWTEQAALGGSGAVGKGWLGSSVALSSDGEVAEIGASRDSHKAGAAWMFADEPLPAVPPPTVGHVTPGRGTTEGGTKVTITGSDFTSATAPVVMFGSTPAASAEVRTAAEIRAVSPAAPEGVVHVRVQTSTGTSAISPDDTFRYESPTKEHGKEKESSGGKQQSSATPTSNANTSTSTTAGPSGGVLGLAQAADTPCRVSLRSKRFVVALHTSAAMRLMRSGSGRCRGTLTLRYKQKLKGNRFKLKNIGSARFSIAPGKSQVVKIKLNKLGRSLFLAGHGKLNASVAVLRTDPLPSLAKTASVRLSVKKVRKAPTVVH